VIDGQSVSFIVISFLKDIVHLEGRMKYFKVIVLSNTDVTPPFYNIVSYRKDIQSALQYLLGKSCCQFLWISLILVALLNKLVSWQVISRPNLAVLPRVTGFRGIKDSH